DGRTPRLPTHGHATDPLRTNLPGRRRPTAQAVLAGDRVRRVARRLRRRAGLGHAHRRGRGRAQHPAAAGDAAGQARTGPLARLQHELPEREPEVPALAGAGKRERHLALGHDLRLARLDRAGVGLGGGIGAEPVADVVHAGELAGTVLDLRLAEAEAAALGADLHRQALA